MTDAAATQRGPSDWIAWALSSILLAVLLVILLWIFYPELLHPSEPEPDVRISALAEARLEEQRLREGLQDLTNKFHRELAQCRPAEPLPACPEPTEADAQNLVIVMDISLSMDFPADIDPELYEQVWLDAWNQDSVAIQRLNELNAQSQINRNQVAKPALAQMIQGLPDGVDIGLVLAGSCDAQEKGFYGLDDRPRLTQIIQDQDTVEYTPLADGLAKAGAMMERAGRDEGLILVVSDGKDSCERDPCAVAQQLFQRLPNVTVNVLDVFGTSERSCLSAPSGGQVFTPTDVSDVASLIEQATEAVLLPEHCR